MLSSSLTNTQSAKIAAVDSRLAVATKAIIAICRMLLTAIWNILSKLVPCSADGYLADKVTAPFQTFLSSA